MLQVAKAYIHEPRDELREGSETSLSGWRRTMGTMEMRGREQGAVMEIPCKRRSAGVPAVPYKNHRGHFVRPIANARQSRRATLQSRSERKEEDGRHLELY